MLTFCYNLINLKFLPSNEAILYFFLDCDTRGLNDPINAFLLSLTRYLPYISTNSHPCFSSKKSFAWDNEYKEVSKGVNIPLEIIYTKKSDGMLIKAFVLYHSIKLFIDKKSSFIQINSSEKSKKSKIGINLSYSLLR